MLVTDGFIFSQEPTSGLRTSEVEPGSPLSYSDMSSVATGVEDVLSSVRPGVNDELAVRAVLSQSGPLVPATGVPGTTDGSTASGPQARDTFVYFLCLTVALYSYFYCKLLSPSY